MLKERNTDIQSQALSPAQLIAYGSPMLPLAMGFSVLIMLIPSYYGLNMGLGLGVVGITMAAGRVFDFITDPLIGIATDRTRTRFGARKPWIALGLCLFCLACYLLFLPVETPSLFYLFFVACLYFLAFTISEIPLAAMGLEISNDKNERTRLAASKSVFFIIGGIAGAIIPAIWKDNLDDALSYAVKAIVISTVMVLPLFLALTPSRSSAASPKSSAWILYKSLLSDQNIRRVLGVFFTLMIAASLSGSLSLLYVSYILEAPDLIGAVWVASGVGILCGLPVWYVVSKTYGKVKSWRLAILIGAVLGMPLLFLGPGGQPVLIAISFALGFCGACETIIPISLLADHVAEQQAKGSSGQAGGITGLKNAASKLSIVIPLLLAFPMLSALGLEKDTPEINALGAPLNPAQSLTLICLYAGVPLILRVLAYGLTRRLWREDIA